MDNFTIKNILEMKNKHNSIKNIFLGVFPRDELPEIKTYPSCFIINTDPKSKPGEHWLAFYIDKNGICDFFDSYGNAPVRFGLEDYLSKFKSWNFSRQKIQGDSLNCGIYCILFLLYRSQNKLKEFYSEFNKTSILNDKKLIYLINSSN